MISIRGYQFQPSGPTLRKTNPPAYQKFVDEPQSFNHSVAQESLISPSVDAKDLEDMGFAKQTEA